MHVLVWGASLCASVSSLSAWDSAFRCGRAWLPTRDGGVCGGVGWLGRVGSLASEGVLDLFGGMYDGAGVRRFFGMRALFSCNTGAAAAVVREGARLSSGGFWLRLSTACGGRGVGEGFLHGASLLRFHGELGRVGAIVEAVRVGLERGRAFALKDGLGLRMIEPDTNKAAKIRAGAAGHHTGQCWWWQ